MDASQRVAWRSLRGDPLGWSSATPPTTRNVIVEVPRRSGRDEAGLGAGDLQRMRRSTPERRVQTESRARGKGRHVPRGRGTARTRLVKHEGGTHRVQSIPVDGSTGAAFHTRRRTVSRAPGGRGRGRWRDGERLDVECTRLRGQEWQSDEHDRLRGAHHPQADRDSGLDAGREVPEAEPLRRRCASLRALLIHACAGDSRPKLGRPARAGGQGEACREDRT